MPEENEKLSAAQRSRVRRLSRGRELAPDEEGGELNVVPFLDIITNVLMFVLATISVTFTTLIDTQPPRANGSSVRPPGKPTLSLNIVVIDKGFIVSAFGQRIGEGCQGPGSGVAVGMRTSDGRSGYDYGALTACAKRLKNQVPEAADETSATITANASIPYQSIIGTCDAIRKADDGQVLFPDITFGVPK
jgi:biopolymer transport protein TolR